MRNLSSISQTTGRFLVFLLVLIACTAYRGKVTHHRARVVTIINHDLETGFKLAQPRWGPKQLWSAKLLPARLDKSIPLRLRGGDEKDSDEQGETSAADSFARAKPASKRPWMSASTGDGQTKDELFNSLEQQERKEIRNKAGRSPFGGKRPAMYADRGSKRLEELMADSSENDDEEEDDKEEEGGEDEEEQVQDGEAGEEGTQESKARDTEDKRPSNFEWARRAQEREARLQGLMQESSEERESEDEERDKKRGLDSSDGGSEVCARVCTRHICYVFALTS
jgi:hypothetical protein